MTPRSPNCRMMLRVPDAIVVQHPIGDIAMRAIHRDIVHIGHVVLDADYFVCRIFVLEHIDGSPSTVPAFLACGQGRNRFPRQNTCPIAFILTLGP